MREQLKNAYEGVKKGAYVVSPATKATPDAILIATGSEVQLAIKAQAALKEEGKDVSVVSIPSFDRFDKQDASYKESVLPKAVKNRVGIEMASSFGWERYVGIEGKTIAIDRFGASANGNKVIEEYGFTVENVVKHVNELF
ncbi:transketolase [Gracilibacillus boraciitolerans JCM 21714]|uniref:transketolase n=1 Tax=Gracilibacillus boraciitolerans JCM 21714 TaxID=1298598 RepID=W4VE94_9BACI|nr:transketolase [Gracilibacillus boraciitolerans JCM 21714]